MLRLDGFPTQKSISFLPAPNLKINKWSKGKTITITVSDYYLNPCTVMWKGQTIWVGDYEFFTMMVKDWMDQFKQTKEQVLDEMFEMAV